MRMIGLLALTLSGMISTATAQATRPQVKDVAFLLGRWTGPDPYHGGLYVEEWLWANDSVMVCNQYSIRKQDNQRDTLMQRTWLLTSGYGPLTLHRTPEVPADSLPLQYFGVGVGPTRAQFVTRWAEFPQSVVYELTMSNELRVLMSGRGTTGKVHRELRLTGAR
jgi:hypothetical protein